MVIVCAEERYEDVVNAFWCAATGLGLAADLTRQLPVRFQQGLGQQLFEKETGLVFGPLTHSGGPSGHARRFDQPSL